MQESMTRGDSPRERRWAQLQAFSGLVFLIFAGLHLTNQMLAAVGPDIYNGFQRALRLVYQHPLIEISVVAGALAVHVVAGVRRMLLRGVRGRGGSARMRLHRLTAYFLLLVIFGHIAAVRGSSLVLGIFPEFEGIAFSLWWIPAYFYVYYLLLAFAGLYHGMNGALLALRMLGLRSGPAVVRGWGFWVPVGAATGLLLLGILGFGGHLFGKRVRRHVARTLWCRFGERGKPAREMTAPRCRLRQRTASAAALPFSERGAMSFRRSRFGCARAGHPEPPGIPAPMP